MAAPVFQKNGPNSANHFSTSSKPALVFRQKSNRPLLLNNVAALSSVASSYQRSVAVSPSSSTQYRFRLNGAPQSAGYFRGSNSRPIVQSNEVDSDQLNAQYFTFTGRYNAHSLISDYTAQGVGQHSTVQTVQTNAVDKSTSVTSPSEINGYGNAHSTDAGLVPDATENTSNQHIDGFDNGPEASATSTSEAKPPTGRRPSSAAMSYALHMQVPRPTSGNGLDRPNSFLRPSPAREESDRDKKGQKPRPPSDSSYRALYSTRRSMNGTPPIGVRLSSNGSAAGSEEAASVASSSVKSDSQPQSYLQRVNSARASDPNPKQLHHTEGSLTGIARNRASFPKEHNSDLKEDSKTEIIFKKNFCVDSLLPERPINAVKPFIHAKWTEQLNDKSVNDDKTATTDNKTATSPQESNEDSVSALKTSQERPGNQEKHKKIKRSSSLDSKNSHKGDARGNKHASKPPAAASKKSGSKKTPAPLSQLEQMHVVSGKESSSNVAIASYKPGSLPGGGGHSRSNSKTRNDPKQRSAETDSIASSARSSFTARGLVGGVGDTSGGGGRRGVGGSLASQSSIAQLSARSAAASRTRVDAQALDEDEEDEEDLDMEIGDDEMNTFEDDDVGSLASGRASVISGISRLGLDDEEPSVSYSRTGSSLKCDEDGFKPALWPSLFTNVPPVIYFSTRDEKVTALPAETKRLLRWKPSTICPNVVKNLITRVGFRWSKRSNDWICYWGKHMKSDCFKTVKEYQKVNHFPGTFQIGRKDKLFRNLSRLQARHGHKHFNFIPHSYVLPVDGKLLKRAWDEGGYKHKWILKPPASARGIGIKVINKWNQIPKKRAVIVQRYISRPFLINGSKFDLRIYVFVSSYDPLRIYVHEDGLVRFASMKYSNSMKSISNRFMHLTNYSVNKNSDQYQSNSDESKCEGHKWTLQALWVWMERRGIDHRKIRDTIHDIVIKTIISSEPSVSSCTKANVKNRRSCFELFGFDVILDDQLKPWILEVNISPSLHTNSDLDISVKGPMIKDLFNILGVTIPDKDEVAQPGQKINARIEFLKEGKTIRDAQLTNNERAKHAFFMQKCTDENVKSTILDCLTAEDVRLLVETEDELNRCGGFTRVFPTSRTGPLYLRFFDQLKYNNLLLDEWIRRHAFMPSRGIAILEQMCEQRAHLGEQEEATRWSPTSTGLSVFNRLSYSNNAQNHLQSAVAARKAKARSGVLRSRPPQEDFTLVRNIISSDRDD